MLAVATRSDHGVRLVDPVTATVVAAFSTGKGPHELAISPDSSFLYSANMGVFPDPAVTGAPVFRSEPDSTVTVIDLRGRRPVGRYTLRGFAMPHGVHVGRDGARLWVTAEEQHAILELDAVTGRVLETWPTTHPAHMVITSPSDDRIYFASTSGNTVGIIRRSDRSQRALVTGSGPEGMAFRPGTDELWVANRGSNTVSVIDTSVDSVVGTIPTGGMFSLKLGFSPDGRTVYVANNASGTISVINARERMVTGSIALGTQPLSVAVAPDGKFLAVSAPRSGDVLIIDTRRETLDCRIKVGRDADGVVWVPRHERPAGSIEDDRFAVAANRIGNWLSAMASGGAWPADARRDGTEANLAEGVAGVTLFFRELHAATGLPEHASQMRRGADWLLTAVPAEMTRPAPFPPRTGLYYGAPGMAFVLDRVYKSIGDRRYRDAVRAVVRWLHEQAAVSGDSGWTAFNDVLFGDAGSALFLLYAARELDEPASRDLAAGVGRRLIARAQPQHGGLTWVLREGTTSVLPNFSHGAAGIGYLLATLHHETGSPEFREGARGAATYLLAIAQRDSGGLYIPYGTDRPEWRTRFDIGWAHGAAGSARFFEQLARVTGDSAWRRYVGAASVAIRRTGIPGEVAWRDSPDADLDRRFGLAGVADFYLDLFAQTRDSAALHAATRIADHILSRATAAGESLHWMHPRLAFMTDPGTPGELTGYLHGAAGYGLLFLRLDAVLRGSPWTLRLPDAF